MSDLIQHAAQRILAQLADNLPDLSHACVLVPNFHAARRLEQALAMHGRLPFLIPPRITTFPAWAATVPISAPLLPDSHRAALLYQALKASGRFDSADLWGVCDELLRLFDELTLHAVHLPDSLTAFTEQLRAAYQARRGRGLDFEARLIHELWYALADDARGAQDAAARYALQLAALAETAARPLFVVGLPGYSPLEQACLDRYAQRQALVYLTPDTHSAVLDVLEAAWPADPHALPIKQRAQALRNTQPISPLSGRLACFGAVSLEQEAQACATQVRLWLAEGKQRITVIVQDRLSARRARALLERAQILVADETGWTLATTAASTILMRWLEALTGGFRFEDVLDLLKSPYLLADQDASSRRQAAWQLESALRRHGPATGLNGLKTRVRSLAEHSAALNALEHLQQAATVLPQRTELTLADWLARLANSLNALGAYDRLLRDAAGQQVLALLARREQELLPDNGRFQLAEFRRWLAGELERAVFVDTSIDSPVVFTHLAATRLRDFDAALILGADAAHLPGNTSASVFFNQRVRWELGLPTQDDSVQQSQYDLIQLIANVAQIRVLWRARQDGEHNPISPWFERLQTLHQLAWHDDLADTCLAELLPHAQVIAPAPAPLPVPTGVPRPALDTTQVPSRISVSAYNSLLDCPYQYFARQVLRLNALDEISSELAKADYGQLVHAILHRFHQMHPVATGTAAEVLTSDLRELTEEAFAPVLADDYFAHAWQHRWTAQIPHYVAWQLAREQEGWRWQAGEIDATRTFDLDNGEHITLYGRLDRVDSLQMSRAVLDYKTGNTAGLKDKAKNPGEDAQLSAYALLLGDDVGQAAFIALDGKQKIETVPLDAEPDAAADATGVRLIAMFGQLHSRAPLPAQGADKVCAWCEMRGLCRKDYWPETQS
ncbi:MAG: PD-(D/E)XK nuclease family protein [Sulfuriferula sp.]